MKKKLKIILIPILVLVIASFSIVGVNLYSKNKEHKRIERMNQGFRAENFRGLWDVQGENFTLLFYLDNGLKMHIRSSYGFDTNGANPMVDALVTDDNGSGSINALESTNGNIAVSLVVINENANSYTVRLSFCDIKNSYEVIYGKDVVITRSNISFNSSDKDDSIKTITDLLIEKFNDYNGANWVPINVTLDEGNNSGELIGNGQISGTATMVKPGFDSTAQLQVSFDIEVTTKPFEFRELNVNGNYIIHNYKTE